MQVGDRAGLTDTGRRRRRNEDSYVLDPPLFAVADGMGGAQAGEVASRLAAAAFREYHEADELEPERRVEALVQEANRRVYERSREDANASGMGTTVTAALVEGDSVAIAHVGDSRAYRIRGDALEQLTEDHSLVADLMRSGRLTPEEAEAHPQRSVITRALGTDPEVDVDTFAVGLEPDDVFLLCSDGLTTMVPDEEILRIVHESSSLDRAASALVKAANKRGGEDNVTVVLFRVDGDGADPPLDETVRLDAPDRDGDTDELEDTLTEADPVPPVAEPTAAPAPAAPAARPAPAPPRRRRSRRAFAVVAALLFVALLLLVAFWGLANAHFVGAEEDGSVAVYQGLPYDVSEGFPLYRPRYVSTLHAAQLTQEERAELFDHELMDYGAARDRLARYEDEGVP
ncbi:MAG TPA: Stp1/IreP family PP2C-type Ser/Thr phosphatase [Gaiellaceae bacterium]|nr:Stp1/IreP family PP2C-type Ser/Thr phosphatase [Gaiellaceae bacterium]